MFRRYADGVVCGEMLIPLTTREMQIKSTVRHQLTHEQSQQEKDGK